MKKLPIFVAAFMAFLFIAPELQASEVSMLKINLIAKGTGQGIVWDTMVEIIRDVLGEHIDKSSIHDDTDIINDLGADSLDYIEIIYACSEAFDVEFVDEEFESLRTCGQLETNIIGKIK